MCKDTPTLLLLQILMDIKTKKANLVAIPHCFDSLFALRKPQNSREDILRDVITFINENYGKRKEIEAAQAADVNYKILRVKTLLCRVITLKSDKYCKHSARSCTINPKIYLNK